MCPTPGPFSYTLLVHERLQVGQWAHLREKYMTARASKRSRAIPRLMKRYLNFVVLSLTTLQTRQIGGAFDRAIATD
jgi:hypothetical protein